MLYSLNGSRPATLPFRIHLNGTTRTDPSSFTPEELKSAGFSGPYQEPEYNSKTQILDWNGNEYFVRPYNTQELEEQWNKIRDQRNQLLKDCDWTQISDYNFDLENKEEWALYRQELRDLPETQSNPFDIEFPLTP
jgi:hypothetical protein